MFRRSDDADDFARRFSLSDAASDIQPLTDRIFVREIFLRKSVVDQHDRHRVLAIARIEGATLFQRNAHGAEISAIGREKRS